MDADDFGGTLKTDELWTRPCRQPAFEMESRAVLRLAVELAENPDGLLQELVATVLELCEAAESAGISFYLPDQDVFRWDAIAGPFPASVGQTVAAGRSPCKLVVERGAILLFEHPAREFPSLAEVDPPIVENLLVPFQGSQHRQGALWAVSHSRGRRFDAQDARLLTSLSLVASAAYQLIASLQEATAARDESSRRAEQLRQLSLDLSRAEENERKRIARVLHDDLQQILAAASTALAHVKHVQGSMSEQLVLLNELIDDARRITRDLSYELSPPILQVGLLPALIWAKRWCAEKHHVHVDVEADPAAEPADQNLRYLLFSSARELIFNVFKHSGTRQAQLRLERVPAGIRLTVSDQGRGFRVDELDTGDRADAGFGLLSLRERVASLGGEVIVESQTGHGTRVVVVVPDGEPATAEAAPVAPHMEAASRARPLRVVLADHQEMLRHAVASWLHHQPDIEVVGEADDAETALELALRYRPDIILIDAVLPGAETPAALRRFCSRLPEGAVVAYATRPNESMEDTLHEAGVAACVDKGATPEALLEALHTSRAKENAD